MPLHGYSPTKLCPLVSNSEGLQLPFRCSQSRDRVVSIESVGDSDFWSRWFWTSNCEGRLADNIRLGSTWVVKVYDAGDVNAANCFPFPRSEALPGKFESEAKVIMGLTDLTNAQIQARVKTLNGLWGTDHAFLWNSQYFAVLLALVILEKSSRSTGLDKAKELLDNLSYALGIFRVKRHLSCMVGMVVLGIMTCGPGAVVPWGVAGGSMATDEMAERGIAALLEDLRKQFRVLEYLF